MIKGNSIFIGTKRQVANQWVQFFFLAIGFGVVIRGLLTWMGIQPEGWGLIAYGLKAGLVWTLIPILIRGRFGEVLNGKRELQPIAPAAPPVTYIPIQYGADIYGAPRKFRDKRGSSELDAS